jgi:hypothetical protein
VVFLDHWYRYLLMVTSLLDWLAGVVCLDLAYWSRYVYHDGPCLASWTFWIPDVALPHTGQASDRLDPHTAVGIKLSVFMC